MHNKKNQPQTLEEYLEALCSEVLPSLTQPHAKKTPYTRLKEYIDHQHSIYPVEYAHMLCEHILFQIGYLSVLGAEEFSALTAYNDDLLRVFLDILLGGDDNA